LSSRRVATQDETHGARELGELGRMRGTVESPRDLKMDTSVTALKHPVKRQKKVITNYRDGPNISCWREVVMSVQ